MAHDSEFVNNLAKALLGFSTAHSVGEEWCSFTDTVPVGGLRYAGQMVTRETYADLWAYAQAQGLVKTEAEWQTLSANGYVPYYSDGDGSTTFRMPKKSGSMAGVFAFGKIANSGELDATTLATGLARVEAEVNNAVRSVNGKTGDVNIYDYPMITDSEDLNNYVTDGTYICLLSLVAESLQNAPTRVAFRLDVNPVGAKSAGKFQIVTAYNGDGVWLRHSDSGYWGEWMYIGGKNISTTSQKFNQEITINGYETEYVTITDLTPYKPVYIAAKNVSGKDTIDVIVTSGSVLDAPLSTSMVIQGSQNATIWFPVIPTGTSLEIAVGDNSGNQVKSVLVAYQ